MLRCGRGKSNIRGFDSTYWIDDISFMMKPIDVLCKYNAKSKRYDARDKALFGEVL